VRPEGLGQFKKSTSSGLEPATFQESLKIKKPGGKVRQARRADNLAAIY
jgi:hypothetical protein